MLSSRPADSLSVDDARKSSNPSPPLMTSELPPTALGAVALTDGSGGVVGLYRCPPPPPPLDGVDEATRPENVACRRGAVLPAATSSPPVVGGCVTDRPSSTDVRNRT